MAVEIRELVIKATVIQDENGHTSSKPVKGPDPIDRALLIRECVKEVISIIENNKHR
ncbi:DUF5908 family protein [Mucilaginibacter phyllosphaerae]|uniref:Uncharacterized protein n=1 Tax=Mucilaginibacter phyllosphaerae TaxID=1812349 RepID=A0ABR6I834_9SPHI|nr:DUF5908 family protein [Mucilaginibacter phyllosphaerae]MBB3969168.1 hypothetical protein [Mucilaginibacter phyllosphaerae]GGH06755.1 hypothetical protein GCM10007352_11110 [Mucilaginibacter phyllosphaerae]